MKTLIISKVDEKSGKELSGAGFKIYAELKDGTKVISTTNLTVKNDVKKVNGIINGNTLVCGSNEISVNVKKLYRLDNQQPRPE